MLGARNKSGTINNNIQCQSFVAKIKTKFFLNNFGINGFLSTSKLT